MKKLSAILLISILAIIFGCTKNDPNGNGGGSSSNNSSPTCAITSPQNGTTFSLSDNITIIVSATDPDGSIAEVKLFIDNMESQTMTSAPYSFALTSGIVSSGIHTIKAVAKDNDGASAESSIVITRSSLGINSESAFRNVVFPDPVPPDTKILYPPATSLFNSPAASS